MNKIQNPKLKFRKLGLKILKLFRISNFEFRICRRGYTLIEVLIYGGIFALFLLLAIQVFITIKTMTANSFVMVSLQQNYARVFSDFNQTIRGAQNVISPSSGSSDTSLSLDDGAVVYQVQDGVLKKTEGGSTVDLTDQGVSVTAISFANIGGVDQVPSIKISLTVDSNYVLEGGRVISEDLQTTVGLR